MFLWKNIRSANPRKQKFKLKLDFDVNSADLSKCCNVQTRGGSLVDICGYEEIPLELSVKKALAARGENLYILASDGLYVLKDGAPTFIVGKSPDAAICFDYRGTMAFSGVGTNTYLIDDTTFKGVSNVGFCSAVVCREQAVVAGGKALHFGETGVFDKWLGIAEINLPVECPAVAAIGNTVYALGDNCYTLKTKAEEIDSKLEQFASGVGSVAYDSVAHFDSKAVFASSNGLYLISQSKLQPIFRKLNASLDFTNSVGRNIGGKYVLSCRSRRSESSGNDVTLALDVDELKVTGVYNFGCDSMCKVGEVLYFVSDSKLYRTTDVCADSCYATTVIDFGSCDMKYLDCIAVKTRRDLDVWISTVNEQRLYRFKGGLGAQIRPIHGAGREFSVKLCARGSMKVDSVELACHTYGGE